MKCSNCGAENVNDARFCFNCGSSIMNDTQPVPTVDDTQDIPEIQQQYDYEQPQYGYEQPQYQYAPVQSQYDYAQNQYTYELPAEPKKSSKIGVVIAILVTVLVLVIAGIVGWLGYNNGWFDFEEEKIEEVEEGKGPQIISLSKDKLYKPGNVELWLIKCTRYEGGVKPRNADRDYVGPLDDIDGAKYFVISVRVNNVKKTDIDFDNLYLSGRLDDKYDLSDRLEIYSSIILFYYLTHISQPLLFQD